MRAFFPPAASSERCQKYFAYFSLKYEIFPSWEEVVSNFLRLSFPPWATVSLSPGKCFMALTRPLGTLNDMKSLRSGSHRFSCFSARAEIPFRLWWDFFRFFSPFARAENPSPLNGIGFSARAELRSGLGPYPCNRQIDFMGICSRNRAEILAQRLVLKHGTPEYYRPSHTMRQIAAIQTPRLHWSCDKSLR